MGLNRIRSREFLKFILKKQAEVANLHLNTVFFDDCFGT